VISQLDQQPLTWRSLINVIVHDGTAELWEMVDSESEKRAVRVALASSRQWHEDAAEGGNSAIPPPAIAFTDARINPY
jgi:hypothetical protein